MIAIAVGLVLLGAALYGPPYQPDWLPRSIEWLGGLMLLGLGYVVVEVRRK